MLRLHAQPTRNEELWVIQTTGPSQVIPLGLNLIRMAVHDGIPIRRVGGVKMEVALVANFLTAQIEPGIQQGIGYGLRQLVRSHIDGAIGINVIIRSSGHAAACQACACVGKESIDSVAAKEAMIAQKVVKVHCDCVVSKHSFSFFAVKTMNILSIEDDQPFTL